MTIPFDKPVVCPVLIGRASYVEAVERFLNSVGDGTGQVALIAGEAGIGKSRLVAEAKTLAVARGLLVLQGGCFELDRSLPYAAVLDLLRAFFSICSPEEISDCLEGTAPELLKLLPELASFLPDAAPAPALDPGQEKRRLFHALARFLTGLTADRSVLVVIEDLHWSDDASLELLGYLARHVAAQPILLLLTYRSDEPNPSLEHFLAELDRERLAAELRLTRLGAPDVDAMLRAIFGLDRPVRANFLGALHPLTDGNPFFIEEVLRSLISAGDIYRNGGVWNLKAIGKVDIPRSVQDAVRRRVEELSEGARHALVLAAVGGRRLDFGLLQELTQYDEDELLRSIKELISTQLVVEESAERFAFRHALTRHAVYSQLLERERKMLHQKIAEATERIYADSLGAHLADLAYHFYRAGAWEKALEYSQRAGEQAQAVYAPHAVAEHLTQALDASSKLAVTPPPELYRARGQAYQTLGDFERARADHEAALQGTRAANDGRAKWQSLMDLGSLWIGQDYARTHDYYQQALELAREIGDPSLIAQSLNWEGTWYVNIEDPLEARRRYEEALAVLEAANDRRGSAETLELLGMATYLCADLIEGADYYVRAVELFREVDDRRGVSNGLAMLTVRAPTLQTNLTAPDVSDLAKVADDGRLALKMACEIGWRAGESFANAMLGYCLGAQGDYACALTSAQSSLDIA